MTTIATFDQAVDAHLLRTRLEDVGIEAFVQDENVGSFSGHFDVNGAVRVQVEDEDVDAAKEFLASDSGVKEE